MKDNKLIYIASPFFGDVERNIEFARAACRFCIDMGHTPIAVHLLYPQILDDKNPAQREAGLKLGFNVLEHCDELIEAFEHGNWSVRTGFVLGALAFIEQVSGGNEWLALKYDGGMWQSFESFSFYHMLHQYGADYCKSFIETLHDTPLPGFAYPAGPEPFISEPELQP